MPRQLIANLHRFRRETFPRYRDRYQALVAEGQRPTTLFIGCSDSRVLPNLLVDAGPGELFVVQNAGAFVPPHDPEGPPHATAAAVEFAVLTLGVTDIVVCGHSHCGAVGALYALPGPEAPHLRRWLELSLDARLDPPPAKPDRSDLERTEQRSIALQLARLEAYPAVQNRLVAGTIALHGWHYIIEDGVVLGLDLDTGRFEPLGGSS